MKINYKELLICIGGPLGFAFLVSLLINYNSYKTVIKPFFAPPSIVFPIAWTILYILMGISTYIIINRVNDRVDKAMILYIIQLILNLLWSFIFFSFKAYLLSFIWILIIILLVILMIREFYSIAKISAFLNAPYLLWLIFALVLNISIYLLN